MKHTMVKKFKYLIFTLITLLFLGQINTLSANEEATNKKFNAGQTIIEHVADGHCIHFFNTESMHVVLYLPCIVYGPKGVDIFMSSNLYDHHGHPQSYTAGSGVTYHLQVDEKGANKEKIMYLDDSGNEVAALDFSITKNVLGLFIGILILTIIFIKIGKRYKQNALVAPKGTQSFFEPLVLFIRDEVARPAIPHKADYFLPFLLTLFFFILFLNLLGLIPFIGGFNVTGNIAVTMVLALLVFIITCVKAKGPYWMHIIAPPGIPMWLMPIMIPVEIIGLISKPFVLMLRLFANVTAGHIIILAFVSLIFIFNEKFGVGGAAGASVISVAFSIFMNLLELLVAFLQAYVFTLLAALYFGSAIEEAHH